MMPRRLLALAALLATTPCGPAPLASALSVPSSPRRRQRIRSAAAARPLLASASSSNDRRENDGQGLGQSLRPDPSGAVGRREAVERAGGIALSSLLLSSSNPSAALAAPVYDDAKKKRLLITGCNSGIGLDAARRMAVRGHEVVMACRTLDKAKAAADKIKTDIANDSEDAVDANSLLKSLKLVPMECDLADLASIKKFAMDLKGGAPFDAVCYNAGLSRNVDAKDVARTRQGFELTVGTNHLGHFYLNGLLMPSLINKDGGRVVVTASSVHDPDSPGGAQGVTATLGDLKGLEEAVSSGTGQFDMVDGNEFNADKAYKDSKLCNVLFTRELQRRLEASGSGIKANSFTPGLIVGTGLFRDQNQVFTKVFDVAATSLLKVGEKTSYGGGALEYMTLSAEVGRTGGSYYYSAPGSGKYGDDAYGKQFGPSEVSREALASDGEGRAGRLWELSEKLVGL